jgi:hypothetical protein
MTNTASNVTLDDDDLEIVWLEDLLASISELRPLATDEELEGLTWDRLVELEPRLDPLFHQCIELHRSVPDAYATWYRKIKPQLLYLAGWSAENTSPALRSSVAWDIVYKVLFDALIVGNDHRRDE